MLLLTGTIQIGEGATRQDFGVQLPQAMSPLNPAADANPASTSPQARSSGGGGGVPIARLAGGTPAERKLYAMINSDANRSVAISGAGTTAAAHTVATPGQYQLGGGLGEALGVKQSGRRVQTAAASYTDDTDRNQLPVLSAARAGGGKHGAGADTGGGSRGSGWSPSKPVRTSMPTRAEPVVVTHKLSRHSTGGNGGATRDSYHSGGVSAVPAMAMPYPGHLASERSLTAVSSSASSLHGGGGGGRSPRGSHNSSHTLRPEMSFLSGTRRNTTGDVAAAAAGAGAAGAAVGAGAAGAGEGRMGVPLPAAPGGTCQDIARQVTVYPATQELRFALRIDDVAGNIRLSLPRGALKKWPALCEVRDIDMPEEVGAERALG